MPLSVASLMTGSSALRSDGLSTITFTPAEIRLRISAIWPLGSVVRLAVMTLETMPEAFAWALMEQIISSRKPLPVSVFEIPTTYFLVVPVLVDPPQAVASNPAASIKPMAFGHLLVDIYEPPVFQTQTERRHRRVSGLWPSKSPTRGGTAAIVGPDAQDRNGRFLWCQTIIDSASYQQW